MSVVLPSKPFTINPNDELPVEFDWTQWLAGRNNDTIASATMSASTGLSVGNVSFTQQTVTGTIAGGVSGSSYTLNCQIVTAGGLIANSQNVVNVFNNAR